MKSLRAILAAFVATIAYYVLGFAAGPLMAAYFQSSAVALRGREAIIGYMPLGLLGTFVAMLVVTLLYAWSARNDPTVVQGTRLGLAIGIFVLCAGTVHEFVIFSVGLGFVVVEGVSALVQWTVAGTVVALVYKSALDRALDPEGHL
jgi:hypothetical protein